MELCGKQKKVLNKPKYGLYFRLFKVATFCCDDNFAHLAFFQAASRGSHLEWFSINRCALSTVHLWNFLPS